MVWVKCRTCLEKSNSITASFSQRQFSSITEEFLLGKSFKEVILMFLPQMVTVTGIDEVICFNCAEVLKAFAKFIKKCIAVEEALRKANEQKKEILIRCEESNRQLTNDSLTQKEPREVSSEYLPRDKQNLQEHPVQSNFKSSKPISTSSDLHKTDCQTVIIEEIIELSDTEEPIPPVQPLSTVKSSYQKSATNCQNNATMKLPNLPHKQQIVVQPIQSTADKIIDSSDTSIPTDCFDELPVITEREESLLKKKDNTVPCTNDVFGNNSTDDSSDDSNYDSGDDNSFPLIFEEVEDTSEDSSDTEQNDDNYDNERSHIIEEGSLHLYPIKSHNRIISVSHTNEILAGAIDSNIDVYQYSASKGELANQRILFLGSVIIQCPACKVILGSSQDLKGHIKHVHPGMEFPKENNDLCNYTLTEEEKSSRPPYKCKECGRNFKTKHSQAKHVRKYEKFVSCNVRKCYFCSEIVAMKDYLEHSKTHPKLFVCSECGQGFATARYLECHSERHQIGKEKLKRELELCPVCGKIVKNLGSHLQTHETGPKTYMCHQCAKFFMTHRNLVKHIRSTHLRVRNFQCEKCKMEFSSASSLKQHNTTLHPNDFLHICEICSKRFARMANLKRHINSHLFDRRRGTRRKYLPTDNLPGPATCKYCSKVFISVHKLRLHLLASHIRRQRYKCKMCPLSFSNYSNRFRHEKKHRNPYFDLSCKVCWMRLDTQEELEQHMIKHESSKKYECQFCGLSFSRVYLLNHHISENHTNVEDLEKEKQAMLADALREFLV